MLLMTMVTASMSFNMLLMTMMMTTTMCVQYSADDDGHDEYVFQDVAAGDGDDEMRLEQRIVIMSFTGHN
eukprot:1255681-Pyramimonas_sp.AAC.1